MKNDVHAVIHVVNMALRGAIVLFDLDGCIIDATHRQAVKKDGSLDLEKYKANSTQKQIAKDSSLPLLAAMQQLQKLGKPINIATARPFCTHTQKWLADRGISPSVVIAREGNHDKRKDHELKKTGIIANFPRAYFSKLLLVDDNVNNINMAKDLGLDTMKIDFRGF